MSKESNDLWKSQNTVRFNMRFTNSSGIPGGLKRASEDTGIAESAYIRQAVIEKLQRDGYLQGDSEPK